MTYKHEIHKFDIQTETGYLETAMHLAFGRHLCAGWRIEPPSEVTFIPRLILYSSWSEDMADNNPANPKNVYPNPVPFMPREMSRIVGNWLASVDYGPEPRTDGSTDKGFRIYNEAWGHVDGDWRAFAAIEPAKSIRGK